MSGHTATPWEVIAGDDYYIRADAYPEKFIGHFKSDDTGPYVACVGNRPADFGEANAAFIVTACNSHADLVACVQAALNMVDGDGFPPDWDFLRQTLKSAALATLTAREVG